MCLESASLTFCGQARAQETQHVVVTFRVRHDDHSSLYPPNCDVAILFVGVFFVVDLEVMVTALE